MKQILLLGVYLGLINVALSVIVYVFDLAVTSMFAGAIIGIVIFFINVLLLVIFGRKIRVVFCSGTIKYKHAFLNAIIMVVVMALMSNVYGYAFYKWIDPGYQEHVKNETAQNLAYFLNKQGIPEKEIDKKIEKIIDQPDLSAEKLVGHEFLRDLGFGLIFSLIAAAMVKKNPDPFSEVPNIEEV